MALAVSVTIKYTWLSKHLFTNAEHEKNGSHDEHNVSNTVVIVHTNTHTKTERPPRESARQRG